MPFYHGNIIHLYRLFYLRLQQPQINLYSLASMLLNVLKALKTFTCVCFETYFMVLNTLDHSLVLLSILSEAAAGTDRSVQPCQHVTAAQQQ